MSIGLSLLRCVVDNEGPLLFLAGNGLNANDFTDTEKVVVSFIESHISDFACIPSLESIKNGTSVELPEIPKEPIAFWVSELKKRTLFVKTKDSLMVATQLLQAGNYKELIEYTKRMSLDALFYDTSKAPISLGQSSSSILDLHDKSQSRTKYDSLNGVPFGFPYLDEVSDGIQSGDTIAILGPSGIGKSYLMCRLANAAYSAGKVPLLLSMEMTSIQLGRRILALRTGVNETRIRKGQLTSFIGRRVIDTEIAAIKDSPTKFHLLDGRLALTVEDLALYAMSLRPDVIYVDGAYLMKTQNKVNSRWEAIAESAEMLKTLATNTKIPIVASYQLNKDGYVFGSKTVGQLASIMLQMNDFKDEGGSRDWASSSQSKVLSITKGRHGEKGSIKISYDMVKTSIEQLDVLSGYKLQQEDTNDEEDFDYDNERIS